MGLYLDNDPRKSSAHVGLRSAEEMFLSVGGRIGYFQGDPRKLVDDIGELKPTIFLGALLAGVLEVTAAPII